SRAGNARSDQEADRASGILVRQSQSRARLDPRLRAGEPEGIQPPRRHGLRARGRDSAGARSEESAIGGAAPLRAEELARARAGKAGACAGGTAARSRSAFTVSRCDRYRPARVGRRLKPLLTPFAPNFVCPLAPD